MNLESLSSDDSLSPITYGRSHAADSLRLLDLYSIEWGMQLLEHDIALRQATCSEHASGLDSTNPPINPSDLMMIDRAIVSTKIAARDYCVR